MDFNCINIVDAGVRVNVSSIEPTGCSQSIYPAWRETMLPWPHVFLVLLLWTFDSGRPPNHATVNVWYALAATTRHSIASRWLYSSWTLRRESKQAAVSMGNRGKGAKGKSSKRGKKGKKGSAGKASTKWGDEQTAADQEDSPPVKKKRRITQVRNADERCSCSCWDMCGFLRRGVWSAWDGKVSTKVISAHNAQRHQFYHDALFHNALFMVLGTVGKWYIASAGLSSKLQVTVHSKMGAWAVTHQFEWHWCTCIWG